jgi:hypothetical protein
VPFVRLMQKRCRRPSEMEGVDEYLARRKSRSCCQSSIALANDTASRHLAFRVRAASVLATLQSLWAVSGSARSLRRELLRGGPWYVNQVVETCNIALIHGRERKPSLWAKFNSPESIRLYL